MRVTARGGLAYEMPDQEYADRLRLEDRLRACRQVLARLLRSDACSGDDVNAAYREITEAAAELLSVERVGVWLFDSFQRQIECVDLFERSKNLHDHGGVVRAEDVPSYFRAVTEERCIAASDAIHDPRTSELATGYLVPQGIGAMLDAPIWVGGHVVGVVCHEHVGIARPWSFAEELLAGTIADFVARVIETAARVRAERSLGVYREHVQQLLEIQTSHGERVSSIIEREVHLWRLATDPTDASGERRSLLDASPVPLVVTRLRDGKIRYADHRAGELFETDTGSLIDSDIGDYHDDFGDRSAFIAQIRRDGRVDGHVAKLKTAAGRGFWALMSARTITYEGEDCIMVGYSDITAQKVAEMAVRQSEETLRVLFEAAPVPLVLSRARDQTVLFANQRAADLFELPIEHIVGQKTPEYYADVRDRDVIVQELMRDGVVEGASLRLRTKSGRELWAMLSARVLDFRGDECFLVGITDVSEYKRLEAQLRELATHDSLTGVINRRRFDEIAHLEFLRVARSGAPLSVAMIDVDHFKKINDDHGHHIGDRVLVALVRACQGRLRANDVLARHGGEEFVVLFPETELEGARAVCIRVHAAIGAIRVPGAQGVDVRPTVSIGIAELATGEDVDAVVRRADLALYRAKDRGRNRIEVDPPTS